MDFVLKKILVNVIYDRIPQCLSRVISDSVVGKTSKLVLKFEFCIQTLFGRLIIFG